MSARDAAVIIAKSLARQLDGDWDADPETGGWMGYATVALADLALAGYRVVEVDRCDG